MKNKRYLLITIILFFTAFVKGQNLFLQTDKDWNDFAGNIECILSSNSDKIIAGKLPVISLQIKYNGKKPFEIAWDDNFGRVLWNGEFVLKASINSTEKTSSEMKYQTSNTYEPSQNITLNRGDSIMSKLDFTSLPGSFIKDFFMLKGKLTLQLYIIDSNNNAFIPIGSKLEFTEE